MTFQTKGSHVLILYLAYIMLLALKVRLREKESLTIQWVKMSENGLMLPTWSGA